MANFNTALEITLSHEGRTLSTDKGDTGNFLNGKFYGTFCGITATFLNQFEPARLKKFEINAVKALTMSDVSRMYKTYIWDAMMNGDTWKHQNLANLCFDFLVNRYGRAIVDITKATNAASNVVSNNQNRLKLDNTTIFTFANASIPAAVQLNRAVLTKRIEALTANKKKLSKRDLVVLDRIKSFDTNNSINFDRIVSEQSEEQNSGKKGNENGLLKWLAIGWVFKKLFT